MKIFIVACVISCLISVETFGSEIFYINSYQNNIQESTILCIDSLCKANDQHYDSLVFTDQKKKIDIQTKKSPFVAFGIAFIPGFFIHGLGHYYAGKPAVGTILLIAGLIGAGILLIGAIIAVAAGALVGPGVILTIFTGTPVGIEEAAEAAKTALAFLNIGGVLFFGSWIYDFIFSPIACVLRNRKMEEKIYNGETNFKIVPLLVVKF